MMLKPETWALGVADRGGVGVDLMAERYLKLVADQNHAPAQLDYGFWLAERRGVEIDLTSVALSWTIAAGHNSAPVSYHSVLCLARGRAVSIDLIMMRTVSAWRPIRIRRPVGGVLLPSFGMTGV
jgi:TPR repeat protein